ncbi:MAG: hypothetical protein JJ895_09675 [Balneolaceae bacterium]|nr:hypothetical protein [Balneolaceae bacterium]
MLFQTYIALFVSILFSLQNVDYRDGSTVNAVVGDESFYQIFDRMPNQFDSENLRISTHLKYVHQLLSTADLSHLSNEQTKKRIEVLTYLEEYINNGDFPTNEYTTEYRRPNFIDSNGAICAVGYLVERTEGRDVAESLNDSFQFDYIMDMNSNVLENWLNTYGLSKIEAAMIQPNYGGFPILIPSTKKVTSKEIGWDYGLISAGFATSQLLITNAIYSSNTELSLNQKYWYSIASTTLGLASIYTGIEGYRSSDRYYQVESNPEETVIPTSNIDERNPRKKALSVLNISLGVFSTLYNGLHAFKYQHEKKRAKYVVYTSAQTLPGRNNYYPSLNINMSF